MAHHLTQLLDDAARRHQKQLTGLSQLDRCAAAVHQGQPEHALQAANPPTKGRLGDEALLRRLGKTAGGGQGDKIFQPFTF